MKPICHMMIGIPGTGKTTYAGFVLPFHPRISTDEYIMTIAQCLNTTYDDVFRRVIKLSTQAMKRDVDNLVKLKCDFIWDQTNTTKNSRSNKIKKLLEGGYDVEAHVFSIPEDHINRLNRPGKSIPLDVIKGMMENFEPPSLEEGFSKINLVNSNTFLNMKGDL